MKGRCREEVQFVHESQCRGMKGRKERQVGPSIMAQVPRTLGAHGPSTCFRGKACRVLPDPHSMQGCFMPYRPLFPSSQSIVYLCFVAQVPSHAVVDERDHYSRNVCSLLVDGPHGQRPKILCPCLSRSVFTNEGLKEDMKHVPDACKRTRGLHSTAAIGPLLFGALHCCVQL